MNRIFINFVCSFLFFSNYYCCFAFNFDAVNVQRISKSEKDSVSYFGYSVLLQADKNDATLFVGAPKSKSVLHASDNNPGALFTCTLSKGSCEEYLVDSKAENNGRTEGQLFGNALDGSSTLGGPLVVCGQRWQKIDYINHYFPNGACYEIRNSSDSSNSVRLNPLSATRYQIKSTLDRVYYYYAFAEAGFSIRYAEDGSHLILGAPGVSDAEGTVIMYENGKPYNSPRIPPEDFFSPGYYEYFGYSIHSGRFSRSFNEYWFAVGAPRGNDLIGQVILFGDKPLLVKKIVNGEQRGSYFGASVAAIDTNNDLADDLLVGSPTFSVKFYDEGCVYYYKNDGFGTFDEPIKIFGMTPGGRFGTTIVDIGDINQDSYKDVAISAPYESNTGVVYIFMGSKEGLGKEYSQKINPQNFYIPGFSPEKIRGFGFSISKGVDVDQNNFNDIAIGAYLSEEVFLVKTFPVVEVMAELKTKVKELQLNDQKEFSVQFCIWMVSNEEVENIVINVNVAVDNRASSDFVGPKTTRVSKNVVCDNVSVKLNENIYSNTSPLLLTLTYKQPLTNHTTFYKTCPIVDPSAKTKTTLEIPFANECQKEVCETDLKLQVNSTNHFTLGTTSNLKFLTTVTNTGEPAYVCRLLVSLPENVDMKQVPSKCSFTDQTLDCLVDNNLKTNTERFFEFDLDLERVGTKTREIVVSLNVSSVGSDVNPIDNVAELRLPVLIDVEPQINWNSLPENAIYYEDDELLKDVNFEQQFLLSNLGVSPMDVDLDIYVPALVDKEQFVQIYNPKALVNGDPTIICTLSNGEFYNDKPKQDNTTTTITPQDFTIPEFNFQKDKQKTFIPDSRIYPIDCRNSRINCAKIKCTKDILKPNHISDIRIKINVDVKKLTDRLKTELATKDIISFVSSAHTEAHNTSSGCDAFTILYGKAAAKKVPIWVSVISVIGGLLVVGLTIYLLSLCNFFKRTYKERLLNDQDDNSVALHDLSEEDI